MKKTLALFISVSFLPFCALGDIYHTDDNGFTMDINGGLRQDNFNWNITSSPPINELTNLSQLTPLQAQTLANAGISSMTSLNIESDLNWKKLNMYEAQIGMSWDVPAHIFENGYIDLSGHYAVASDGKITETDYLSINSSYSTTTALSNSKSNGSSTYGGKIAAGYNFYFNNNQIKFTPLLGYSYQKQKLLLKEGKTWLNGSIDTAAPSINKSSYHTSWKGGFIGAELRATLSPQHNLKLRGEYQIPAYNAKGSWILPSDFVQSSGYSFIHSAKKTTGTDFLVSYSYLLDKNINLSLTGKYKKYSGKHGSDTTFFGDGTSNSDTLNKIRWKSRSLLAGFSYDF